MALRTWLAKGRALVTRRGLEGNPSVALKE